MDEEKKLALPSGSPEMLARILHAYALCGDKPVGLDSVAQRAGLNKTQVSGNHGFLVSLGLLEGGKAKTLTPEGRELALAINHDLAEDVAAGWRRTLHDAPAMQGVIGMFRVQRELQQGALPGRIGAALGIPMTSATRTGINSLIDLLERCGILLEADGKYRYAAPAVRHTPDRAAEDRQVLGGMDETPSAVATVTEIAPKHPGGNGNGGDHQGDGAGQAVGIPARLSPIPIHVNIELHLPASSEQGVYDALFKSIRENLLS
jgi:hypothetical protein